MKLILVYLGHQILHSEADRETTVAITDTKLYVPVLNSWTQDDTKLLHQLKSRLRRTINWNKYQSKISTERPNQYLNYLIDPSFQGVDVLFYHLKIMHNGQDTESIFLPK